MPSPVPTPLHTLAPCRVGLLLWPGFGLMALAGVVDTLHAANQVLDDAAYEAVPLAVDAHGVQAGGGVAVATRPLADAPPLDLVLLLSDGVPRPAAGDDRAARLLAWLVAQAAAGRTLGGVGSGALWLAEAGLLRGHRATVHWPHIHALAEQQADVVVSQQLFEIDRQRLSCAGAQASRDLLIAWLAQRHGAAIAPALAALLGLARVRGADERQQLPLAARLAAQQGGGSAKLAEALALMEANLAEPLPTEDIARLAGVSRRQLERLFRQHLGALPSRWYLELRLQRAQRQLRQTHQSVLQIGLACGFASGPHFSNAYRAHFGRTPRDERSVLVRGGRDAAAPQPQPQPLAADLGRAP
jgi:transcriptional regulator GlxA family with amidase domain